MDRNCYEQGWYLIRGKIRTNTKSTVDLDNLTDNEFYSKYYGAKEYKILHDISETGNQQKWMVSCLDHKRVLIINRDKQTGVTTVIEKDNPFNKEIIGKNILLFDRSNPEYEAVVIRDASIEYQYIPSDKSFVRKSIAYKKSWFDSFPRKVKNQLDKLITDAGKKHIDDYLFVINVKKIPLKKVSTHCGIDSQNRRK